MGVYDFHLLSSDSAHEVLEAVRENFGLSEPLPVAPGGADAAVLAARGEEMARWVTSSAFSAKGFANKKARIAFLAVAFLESGAPLPAALKRKAIAAAEYLGHSHPDATLQDTYRFEELANLVGRQGGERLELSGSLHDLLVRDPVTDPRSSAAAMRERLRWRLSGGGRVAFADDAARQRAAWGFGHEVPGPMRGDSSHGRLLERARALAAARPPFNLRIPADFAIWADLEASAADIAEARPVAGALAGVVRRLEQVAEVLAMETEPTPSVTP
jgi:hypothetical protein